MNLGHHLDSLVCFLGQGGWVGLGLGFPIAIEIQFQNYYSNIWDKQPNGLDPSPLDLSLASLHNPPNLGKKRKKKKKKKVLDVLDVLENSPSMFHSAS